MKRVTRFFLALTLIISMLVPVCGVQAALGIKHEKEVSLLSALNIVPGYPDPSYKAEDKVKTEDFVKYASALVGAEVDASFAVTEYGLSRGADIAVSEAVTVIMKALGYDKIAFSYNGSIASVATVNGLMDGCGVTADSDEFLTRDSMSVILFNALEMKALEMRYVGGKAEYGVSDKTVMEYYLNIYYKKGDVNATSLAALNGYSVTGKNEVRIGDDFFYIGRTDARDLIGYNVEIYYIEKHGENTILWIEPTSRTKTLIVYGEDIEEINDNTIKYLSGNSTKTAKLNSDYTVIYNGEFVSSVEQSLLRPLNGYNLLIDSNGDGKYDVIDVKDYKYYFVDGYNASQCVVNDYKAEEKLEFGTEHFEERYFYQNGVITDASAIKTGVLLAVLQSKGNSCISIEIINNTVEGTINGIDQDTIKISGTEYLISNDYKGTELRIGYSALFYLDKNKRIVRAEIGKSAASRYGYVINMWENEDGTGDYGIRLLAVNGTISDFAIDEKIVYNGSKIKTSIAYQNLKNETADGSVKQLITYSLNSRGEVSRINSANSTPLITGSDEQVPDFSKYYKGVGSYRKSNMCFNSKYMIDESVPIFLVPYDGDKDSYYVETSSYLVNKYVYDIEVYDVDEYMKAGALVLRENMREPENLRSKRAFIVKKVTTVYDENESSDAVCIDGYMQGTEVSYILEREDIMDTTGSISLKYLKCGDILQVSLTPDGKLGSARILYKRSLDTLLPPNGSTTGASSYWEGGSAVMPDLYISRGKVVSRNNEVILVDADGDENVVTKRMHKVVSGVNVFKYEDGNLDAVEVSDIQVGDDLYVQEYQGTTQDIIVFR